jgi:antitoxin component YwqK of YwqJK toxin-antitoxin module
MIEEIGKPENHDPHVKTLNSSRIGLWFFYYPNGILKERAYYIDDKISILWESFDEKGGLIKRL